MFAPENPDESGPVKLDTAAIAAAYGSADSSDSLWYRKIASELNMEEELYYRSIYDDLSQGTLRTVSENIQPDEDSHRSIGDYKLTIKDSDISVLFTDFDRDYQNGYGNELFGVRFRKQGDEYGFGKAVQLTDMDTVLDEIDVYVTDSGEIHAVSDSFVQYGYDDGTIGSGPNTLLHTTVTPSSSVTVPENSVLLPEHLYAGSFDSLGFELYNPGLSNAYGYEVTVNRIADGQRTEIGHVSEQNIIRGGEYKDMSVALDIPDNRESAKIEISVCTLDESGKPVGEPETVVKDMPHETNLLLEDVSIVRNGSDGEGRLTATLHNTGNRSASASELNLVLIDGDDNDIKTLQTGSAEALEPGGSTEIGLDFSIDDADFTSGCAELELRAASPEDSEKFYVMVSRSMLYSPSAWSINKPEPEPEPEPKPHHGGSGGSGSVSTTPVVNPPTDNPVTPPSPADIFDSISACTRDVSCPVNKFTDTDPNKWYHDGVHWALAQGVMNGTGDGLFVPDGTATRAMTVTMLWRLDGEPAGGSNPFEDVQAGSWYEQAVNWAFENNIVKGRSDTVFSPDDPVTREQLAAILYRYAQQKGLGFTGAWAFTPEFSDAADITDYAYEPMCWMNMNGIIQGMDDGTLLPKDNSTRAQIATMFMRFRKKMMESAG